MSKSKDQILNEPSGFTTLFLRSRIQENTFARVFLTFFSVGFG